MKRNKRIKGVLESIPYQSLDYKTNLFKLNKDTYSCTLRFTDINYYTASNEEKEDLFEPFYEYEDYCALEESVYQNAEAAGFEQYLAKTSFYKTIKNCYVYVQEKVYTLYSDKASTPSEGSRKKIDERNGEYLGNKDWSACFIDFFGEDAFEKFYNYCVYGDDEHEMCIADDLHSGNIGFRADGSPVILDYSGWACE